MQTSRRHTAILAAGRSVHYRWATISGVSQFVVGLASTTFGVFLGSPVASIRERALRRRSQRELINSAVLELQHFMLTLKAIRTGIDAGNLAETLGTTYADAVRSNVPAPLTVKTKAL